MFSDPRGLPYFGSSIAVWSRGSWSWSCLREGGREGGRKGGREGGRKGGREEGGRKEGRKEKIGMRERERTFWTVGLRMVGFVLDVLWMHR